MVRIGIQLEPMTNLIVVYREIPRQRLAILIIISVEWIHPGQILVAAIFMAVIILRVSRRGKNQNY